MTHDLSELVLLYKDNHTAERGAIILLIDDKKKGPEGVTIQRDKGRSFFDRLWKSSDYSRRIMVRTGTSIEMHPIQIDCEHIASEVTYRVTLKFDLQTPRAEDETALYQLGHTFRSATLESVGGVVSGSPADSPTGRFVREMTQWLRARYRAGGNLEQHADQSWLASENNSIASHIRREFGLDAQVKLKFEVPPDLRLGPVTVEVVTTPSDSDTPIKFKITASCVLVERDVFTARALTKADLQKRIATLAEIFVRQWVTLQQFRFEPEWVSDLRTELELDLKQFDRRITEFLLPLSQKAIYHKGPHAIHAGDAVFQPAGWNDGDRITFSSNAKIEIVDAAKFEVGRSTDALLKVDVQLTQWLRTALQSAVQNVLHDIHMEKTGYAHLLINWSAEGGLRDQIEAHLAELADKEGLNAIAIIAKPDREEMNLLSGARLVLGKQSYPSASPDVMLEFEAEVQVSVDSFADIKELLNTSHDPLGLIEKELVLPALQKATRKFSYHVFHSQFDHGPGPSGADGRVEETGCVGRLRAALKEALAGHKIRLVSFTASQTRTEHYAVYTRLISSPARKVSFDVDRMASYEGQGQVTDPYTVEFDLQINGLSEKKMSVFLTGIWAQLGDEGTEYDAVLQQCNASLGRKFDDDNVRVLRLSNMAGADRQDFETLIQTRLSDLLSDYFGLAGVALHPKCHPKGRAMFAIAQAAGELKVAMADIEVQTGARIDQIELIAKAQTEAAQQKADMIVNEARIELGETLQVGTSLSTKDPLGTQGEVYIRRPARPISPPTSDDTAPDDGPSPGPRNG